jgi:nucleoside 2-deoxyribosyltransferase
MHGFQPIEKLRPSEPAHPGPQGLDSAAASDVTNRIRHEVSEADIVVLIFARRRGSPIRRINGTFVEVEYNIAAELGKPVLVFASREEQSVHDEYFERLQEQHPVIAFDTPEELASIAARSLEDWQRETATGSNAFQILFAPQLTPEQVERCLDALADYFRACGGAGLESDFEIADVLIQEPADVLA